jgi:hypothetical protein
MKILAYLLLFLMGSTVFSQNDKLTKAIMKGKTLIIEADTLSEYISAANYFERVALSEPGEWLPAYYHAQALTFGAMSLSNEKKEELLNTALKWIKDAQKTDQNDELVAMEGFIQMMRLTVDPGTRGQTLSPLIFRLLGEALNINPENPRALLFMGQLEFGTAQFFGTDTEKACTYIQKALPLLADESGKDTIFPSWGLYGAQQYENLCEK